MKTVLLLLIIATSSLFAQLKVLHLCFHTGCASEIVGVVHALNHEMGCDIELTSYNVLDDPFAFDKKIKKTSNVYKIDHQRAARIWKRHAKFFNQFDAILVSDTAPLARIFLQNGWNKPLIIWVTNRFNWKVVDNEYYELLRKAKTNDSVFFAIATPFEGAFAKKEAGVDLGDCIIKACAPYISPPPSSKMLTQALFLHQHADEVQARHPWGSPAKRMAAANIAVSSYRYKDLSELASFKGVVYFPYQWSVMSFSETVQLGLPTFVPSKRFLAKLMDDQGYWMENGKYFHQANLSEWYGAEESEVLIYFDSLEDLREKVRLLDDESARAKMRAYAKERKGNALNQWYAIFSKIINPSQRAEAHARQ